MNADYLRMLEFGPPAEFEKQALTASELATEAAKVEPNPTEEQKKAGNYRKGHVTWKGIPITIETAKGQTRSGTDKNGKTWSTLMRDHYGYVKLTESEADGDHIDVFLSDNLDSEIIFVVNQVKPGTLDFDEHKCILGTVSKEDARAAYLRNYAKGWKGLGSITALTLEQFKWWMEHGDTSKPVKEWQGNSKTGFDLYAPDESGHS